MAIVITIGGIDRTSVIESASLNKKDIINEVADTLTFDLKTYPNQTFRPTTNVDVIMTDAGTRVFGGRIQSFSTQYYAPGTATYSVTCVDYGSDLGRTLVNEGYENVSVNAVIADIMTTYAPGFTFVNVNCPLLVTKVSFSRITVTEAIQRLADLTSFSWYMDYFKDLHFFERSDELSPFNITDGNGNYITETLSITKDFSQIRNRVFVEGGETVGEPRTEEFDGNGVRVNFKLSNKFATLPTVTVNGVGNTVGIDFLDDEASFDCFWNFEQTYIRFKTTTVPPVGTANVDVTGDPLFNLVVQVEDAASVATYGAYEFAKIDKTMTSRDEIVGLALAELNAYKAGIDEGSFQTYTPGLRSGQVITVNSTILGINEDFVIQSVSYKIRGTIDGIWDVRLATLKTVELVNFLINLLRQPGHLIEETGETILEKTVFPQETLLFSDAISINTDGLATTEILAGHDDVFPQALNFNTIGVAGPYVHATTGGVDTKRLFILDTPGLLG